MKDNMEKGNYLNIDFDNNDSDDNTLQTTFKVSKTSKVEHLIKEKSYEKALSEIDLILEGDDDYTNWNLKGIILDKLAEYEKAIECFDNALKLKDLEEIKTNKANSLYNFAKITFFPEGNYEKALELIDYALDTLPKNQDPSEFYFLKAEILEGLNELVESHKAYLTAYKEFERLNEFESQIEYLNNTQDTLVSITGTGFYNYTPESGDVVCLIRDSENEHDPDAIAVMKENKIVGYVANSSYTLIDEVKSATDIRKIMNDDQKAEILFNFLGEYTIAKLI